MKTVKCAGCGKQIEVSRDGWLVESYQHGKREVRYTSWFHVVGHWHPNGNMCKGSGSDPVENKQAALAV